VEPSRSVPPLAQPIEASLAKPDDADPPDGSHRRLARHRVALRRGRTRLGDGLRTGVSLEVGLTVRSFERPAPQSTATRRDAAESRRSSSQRIKTPALPRNTRVATLPPMPAKPSAVIDTASSTAVITSTSSASCRTSSKLPRFRALPPPPDSIVSFGRVPGQCIESNGLAS
jgi:hypothetical protein